jgi:hypothetical protein
MATLERVLRRQLKIRLVRAILEDSELIGEAAGLAARVAVNPRPALMFAKRLLPRAQTGTLA